MQICKSRGYRTKYKVSGILTVDSNRSANTLQATLAEQASLESKNNELADAFREKSKSQQQIQKRYQSLKAQVMATHVANAAGDEADFTVQTARGDRFVDRIPGARTGTANLSQLGPSQHHRGGRHHNRGISGSSGSSGHQQQRGGLGLAPAWNPQLQGRSLGRVYTGSEFSPLLSCHLRRRVLGIRVLITFQTQLRWERPRRDKSTVVGCQL